MAPKHQDLAIFSPTSNPTKFKPIKKTQKRCKPQSTTPLPFKFQDAETFTSLPDLQADQQETRLVEVELWSAPKTLTIWQQALGSSFSLIL